MRDSPLIPAIERTLYPDRFIEINVLDLPWDMMYELKRFLTDKEVIVEGKIWMRIQQRSK